MIVIVDYMMGNLRSVHKACLLTRKNTVVSAKAKDVAAAAKIILPGVGAFADAMRELKRLQLIDVLKSRIAAGIPFLGICLGMQLLFCESEESPGTKGLSIIAGKVKKFSKRLKVPQIGWNQLEIAKRESAILQGIKNKSFVYFCHSYYCIPKNKSYIAAYTNYGGRYTSVIAKDNIFGMQFHPEKSQQIGLNILNNFLEP